MRCFFNLVSAHDSVLDEVGLEVDDIAALRAEVIEANEELRNEYPCLTARWKGWRLEVTDSSGAILFTVDLGVSSTH